MAYNAETPGTTNFVLCDNIQNDGETTLASAKPFDLKSPGY